jgi:hypothetical protein
MRYRENAELNAANAYDGHERFVTYARPLRSNEGREVAQEEGEGWFATKWHAMQYFGTSKGLTSHQACENTSRSASSLLADLDAVIPFQRLKLVAFRQLQLQLICRVFLKVATAIQETRQQ